MDELKEKIAAAFDNFDKLKTPPCLDTRTIGLLADNKLSENEAAQAEAHVQSCLYCLDKLTEMKELLYLAAEAEPVSPALEKKLEGLFPKHKGEQ